MEWLEFKVWLESATALDRDALHIYCAVLIQFCAALFFRRSLASIWPWLCALAAVLANEYIDYQSVGETEQSVRLHKAAAYHDIWNTMVLPTLLFLLARFVPKMLVGQIDKDDAEVVSTTDEI